MQLSTYFPYGLAALIDVFVALDFWRNGRTLNPPHRWHSVLIGLSLILHGQLLYQDIFIGDINLNIANAISLIFWLTLLIYWIASFKQPLQILQAFVLPLAGVGVILQAGFINHHVVSYASDPLFITHITIAMLAYSLLTFAALHALLMAYAEKTLHHKTKSMFPKLQFPPLMVMETLLFQMINLGFWLLSITLVTGMLFSEQIFHQALKFNHKNVFTILAWLIFGALILGRARYGWRGKTAIRGTLIGFVLLLLAYIGSKFVLEVLLGRY
jgi:ABC-type uncharacterized transport system permease subunit